MKNVHSNSDDLERAILALRDRYGGGRASTAEYPMTAEAVVRQSELEPEVNETLEGGVPDEVDTRVVYVGSSGELKSDSRKRQEKIARRIKLGAGVFAIGTTAAVILANSGGQSNESASPLAAMIGADKSVLDGGHNVGTISGEQFAIADIRADTNIYFSVTANEENNPDVTTEIFLSDRPDLTGGGVSRLPDNYQFAEEPFGDTEKGKTSRAPYARLNNTVGFRLVNDDGGTVIDSVPGDHNAVRVSRNTYGIETYIPKVGDPAAPEDAYDGYEAILDKKMFNKAYVSDEAYEAYAATVDGDRSTSKKIDINPVVANGHRVKVLEALSDEACYADVQAKLDGMLIDFVKTELKKEKNKDVEVELVGAYRSPADTYRKVLGDQLPQIDGEGDETRFTGDFMFGESVISCDNVRVGNVFDAYKVDAGKEKGEKND